MYNAFGSFRDGGFFEAMGERRWWGGIFSGEGLLGI
jgi:hypothetical protein